MTGMGGQYHRNIQGDFNWETTIAYQYYSDPYYICLFTSPSIKKEHLEEGTYMKSLTKQELIGWAYMYRGNELINENCDLSIEYYNKSIELYPNFPETYYNRGVVYNFIGKTEKADTDLEKAKKSGIISYF